MMRMTKAEPQALMRGGRADHRQHIGSAGARAHPGHSIESLAQRMQSREPSYAHEPREPRRPPRPAPVAAGAIDMRPIGYDAIAPSLEVVTQLAYEQKLVPSKISVEELFAESRAVLGDLA